MKLQRTAPFRPPILVEIHNQIQPPVQTLGLVIIEIHVGIQILTVQIFVRSAAIERWIEQKIGMPVISLMKSKKVPDWMSS